MNLDSLDKNIVQCLSQGVYSYEQLAEKCNVTRNTKYRRITALEQQGILRNLTKCTVNYDKLNLSILCISAKITHANKEQAYANLKANPYVKLLWRCYGNHANTLIVLFCPKGNEGQVIQDITAILEDYHAENVQTMVGFTWEKLDFSPFAESDTQESGLIDSILVSAQK
jgi:DNA-binding Lrp family transcriptional regulator